MHEFGESPFVDEAELRYPVTNGEVASELEYVPIDEYILGGTDTRTLFSKTTLVPYRWICSVECLIQNPRWGSGAGQSKWLLATKITGFLIAPASVLTVAHHLWFNDGRRWRTFDRLVVRPGLNERNAPFGSIVARRWLEASHWKAPTNASTRIIPPSPWDFALIRLKKAIGTVTFPTLGNKPLNAWGRAGTSVKSLKPAWLRKKRWPLFTAGYPIDKCGTNHLPNLAARRVCIANTPDLWASTMWRSRGKLESVDHPPGFILHSCDTEEGQSGSPVWYYWFDKKNKQPKRWVIGIHAGGDNFQLPGGGSRRLNYAVWLRPAVINEIAALEARLP